MMRQQTATQGLSLSPILAAFQKRPLRPVRYGSMSWGAFILTYVQVQMKSSSVTKKDGGQGPLRARFGRLLRQTNKRA